MANPSNDISDVGMLALFLIVSLLAVALVWLICRSAKKTENPAKKIRKTSSPYDSIEKDDNNTIVNSVYNKNNNGLMRYRRFNMTKKGKMHYQVVKYDF